jgi:hypothetical protein
MTTLVHHAGLLQDVLRNAIGELGPRIRRTQAFSAFKSELRAQKAALLAVAGGHVPDTSVPAVRAVIAERIATVRESLHAAENPAYKAALRTELTELHDIAGQL